MRGKLPFWLLHIGPRVTVQEVACNITRGTIAQDVMARIKNRGIKDPEVDSVVSAALCVPMATSTSNPIERVACLSRIGEYLHDYGDCASWCMFVHFFAHLCSGRVSVKEERIYGWTPLLPQSGRNRQCSSELLVAVYGVDSQWHLHSIPVPRINSLPRNVPWLISYPTGLPTGS